MEGICPLLREFKDSQEVELVIERVPPRDKEDRSEYKELMLYMTEKCSIHRVSTKD